MKNIFIIFLLLVSPYVGAQSISSDYQPMLNQSSWMCEVMSCGVFWGEFLTTAGDTTLNGQSYTKFISVDSLSLLPWGSGGWAYFVRENIETRQVWQYNTWDSTEYLLYDFSLAIGDTIAPNEWQQYVVTDIDLVSTNAGMRRRFTLTDLATLTDDIEGEQQLIWIEGVGNQYNPFDSFLYFGIHTVCKWDGNKLIVGEDCDDITPPHRIATSTQQIVTTSSNQVAHQFLPNPTSSNGRLVIAATAPLPQRIVVYDIAGNEIKRLRVDSNSSRIFEINLSDLPNGTYVYRIVYNSGQIESGKILKLDEQK